jgi:two-component system, NarL family, response regulator DesR
VKTSSPLPPISRRPGPLPARPIRVVIADDHAIVLGGLASLLALESDLAVVAACSNGETTIEAVRAHEVDVLLLDLCKYGWPGERPLDSTNSRGELP